MCVSERVVTPCCVGGLFSVLLILLQISKESNRNRFHLIPPFLSPSLFPIFYILPAQQTALSLPQSECRHLPALFLSPPSLPLFCHTKHTPSHTAVCFSVSGVIKETEVLRFYSITLPPTPQKKKRKSPSLPLPS